MIEVLSSFGTYPRMRRLVHRVLLVIGLGVAAVHCSGIQRAEAADGPCDYPSRTVRIVVPFPAGGTADVLPRIIAQKLRERWNQPVVVENKSGAGGNIGAASVATA